MVIIFAIIFVIAIFLIPRTTSVEASSAVDQQTISACKNRVDIAEADMHWLFIPQSAQDMHTEIDYPFLAGQLIINGSVDASSCPAGGLGSGGFANACGLAVTKDYVNKLQNVYDVAILQAWQDFSVPPVMLKQLIRYESQFWPGRWGEYHYGLGHLTASGAYTALEWRPTLNDRICPGGNCSDRVDSSEVALLLEYMDASCPTCPGKIDINKAVQSVSLLAEAVYGHCLQTARVVYNATERPSVTVVDYATLWKLTLMNYNVGPTCVLSAVRSAYKYTNPLKVTWQHIENFTTSERCLRGVYYANIITSPVFTYP